MDQIGDLHRTWSKSVVNVPTPVRLPPSSLAKAHFRVVARVRWAV